MALVLAATAAMTLATRAVAQNTKHIFYRVTGPSGARVYLLGSVHALPADASVLPTVVDDAFNRAKAVVFEANLDSLEAHGQELEAKATLNGGATFKSSLSPEILTKVREILAAYGVTFEQVAQYKPWFVTLALQNAVAQQAAYYPHLGVDAQLNKRAVLASKPRLSLETAEYQIGLFDAMTPKQQEAELLSTKRPIDAYRELETMKWLWMTGDADALDSLTHAGETPATAEFADALLVKRNQNWFPKIEGWVRGRDDMLVVVGSAHVVGKDGLVAMLRAKGYRVDQL
ncbi:MAG TPA: TraB/GumN family protein [Gemmatimonadaceae bacterium]